MECKCGSDEFMQDRGIMEEGYLVEYNLVCVNCNTVLANWAYGDLYVYEENLMPEIQEFEVKLIFIDGSTHTVYVDAIDEDEAFENAKDIVFIMNT